MLKRLNEKLAMPFLLTIENDPRQSALLRPEIYFTGLLVLKKYLPTNMD
jgi:hypothetical protein